MEINTIVIKKMFDTEVITRNRYFPNSYIIDTPWNPHSQFPSTQLFHRIKHNKEAKYCMGRFRALSPSVVSKRIITYTNNQPSNALSERNPRSINIRLMSPRDISDVERKQDEFCKNDNLSFNSRDMSMHGLEPYNTNKKLKFEYLKSKGKHKMANNSKQIGKYIRLALDYK